MPQSHVTIAIFRSLSNLSIEIELLCLISSSQKCLTKATEEFIKKPIWLEICLLQAPLNPKITSDDSLLPIPLWRARQSLGTQRGCVHCLLGLRGCWAPGAQERSSGSSRDLWCACDGCQGQSAPLYGLCHQIPWILLGCRQSALGWEVHVSVVAMLPMMIWTHTPSKQLSTGCWSTSHGWDLGFSPRDLVEHSAPMSCGFCSLWCLWCRADVLQHTCCAHTHISACDPTLLPMGHLMEHLPARAGCTGAENGTLLHHSSFREAIMSILVSTYCVITSLSFVLVFFFRGHLIRSNKLLHQTKFINL